MGSVAESKSTTLADQMLAEARRSPWGLLPTLVREANGTTHGPLDFVRALALAEELPHEIERADLIIVGQVERDDAATSGGQLCLF